MRESTAKVKVIGLEIPVVISDELFQREGRYGDYDESHPIITISNGDEQRMQDTFWHETIEAINDTLDLKLKHRQINALAAALHQIHADNNIDEILVGLGGFR